MAGSAIFRPQASDYSDWQQKNLRQSIRRPKFAARLLFGAAIAAVGIVVILGILGEPIVDALSLAGVSAVFGILGVLLIIGSSYLMMPRRSARTFAQQKTLHHEMTARWSDTGFGLSTPFGETNYPWGEFHGWTESPRLVLILSSEAMAHFVPKRALDAEALADLRNTLTNHGPPRR